MKQKQIIGRLSGVMANHDGIDGAVLYGSFGRGDANPNSDIDIQILVSEQFTPGDFKEEIEGEFGDELLMVMPVEIKKKIVVYFKTCPKAEVQICSSLEDFNLYFLGSNISDLEHAILLDQTQGALRRHLNGIIYDDSRQTAIDGQYIRNLISKFIYEFENCSNMHKRSDAFHAYFFYNAALHAAIQLKHISCGEKEFNFLPRKLNSQILPKNELEAFYKLKGTLYLPEFNEAKRRLLKFFYDSIEGLVTSEECERVTALCESFWDRDRLWNFRSLQLLNPKVSAPIYRCSTLSIVSSELFNQVKEQYQIKTIIDLRANCELEAMPYDESLLSGTLYYHIPFDPWDQPEWFQAKYNQGTNEEITYKYFLVACKEQIAKVLRIVMNESGQPIVIHCFAGKDRTGIISTLLHMLTGADEKTIENDYLASESDTRLGLLQIVNDYIQKEGGIESYLLGCGMSEAELDSIKAKLQE